MTTQDIYFGIQMGLQVLVGGGVVWGICWLGGVLKRAIESQEKTIAAQAEQMKAQSTVLQDFERLNKTMQQVIATVDAPAMIERWQKYKELVDQEAQAQLKRLQAQFEEQSEDQVRQATQGLLRLVNAMLLFLPPELRHRLIEEAGFLPALQQQMQQLAALPSYSPMTVQVPLTAQFHRDFCRQLLGMTPASQKPETDRP